MKTLDVENYIRDSSPSRVQLKKNMMKIVFALVLFALSISEGHASGWPSGQYCLPMPDNQKCPSGWAKGYRYHDTEDTGNQNKKCGHVPFLPDFGRNIEWSFCCRTCTTIHCYQPHVPWPKGQYCIFRKGGVCPHGFKEGSMYWDDEDTGNGNRVSGTLPDGSYSINTKIYFCCRNDGSQGRTLHGQSLPSCKSLMLMRYNNHCPTVPGYWRFTGYLEWDTENSGNIDKKHGAYPDGVKSTTTGIRIEFCTYKSSGNC